MSRLRLFMAACVALLLLMAAAGVGMRWYLFGPNQIDLAELVPANTLFFASIPNAATLADGFQTSKARALLYHPNAKTICDRVVALIGKKNADLVRDFLPNLSGQSFIAVTHFEIDHPEHVGLIAAMKPKAGLDDFGRFLTRLKETWPEIGKQGETGKGDDSDHDEHRQNEDPPCRPAQFCCRFCRNVRDRNRLGSRNRFRWELQQGIAAAVRSIESGRPGSEAFNQAPEPSSFA